MQTVKELKVFPTESSDETASNDQVILYQNPPKVIKPIKRRRRRTSKKAPDGFDYKEYIEEELKKRNTQGMDDEELRLESIRIRNRKSAQRSRHKRNNTFAQTITTNKQLEVENATYRKENEFIRAQVEQVKNQTWLQSQDLIKQNSLLKSTLAEFDNTRDILNSKYQALLDENNRLRGFSNEENLPSGRSSIISQEIAFSEESTVTAEEIKRSSTRQDRSNLFRSVGFLAIIVIVSLMLDTSVQSKVKISGFSIFTLLKRPNECVQLKSGKRSDQPTNFLQPNKNNGNMTKAGLNWLDQYQQSAY